MGSIICRICVKKRRVTPEITKNKRRKNKHDNINESSSYILEAPRLLEISASSILNKRENNVKSTSNTEQM